MSAKPPAEILWCVCVKHYAKMCFTREEAQAWADANKPNSGVFPYVLANLAPAPKRKRDLCLCGYTLHGRKCRTQHIHGPIAPKRKPKKRSKSK